jgi:hypothetical protein
MPYETSAMHLLGLIQPAQTSTVISEGIPLCRKMLELKHLSDGRTEKLEAILKWNRYTRTANTVSAQPSSSITR